MNKMNERSELENQLLLWRPRGPSAALEQRLFAGGPVPAEALAPFRFTWLAPMTAALMLMCVLFNQHYGETFSASAGAGPLVAMILSNQSAPAYLPGSFQSEHNNLPADAFKWTSHSGSAAGGTSLSRSNGTDL